MKKQKEINIRCITNLYSFKINQTQQYCLKHLVNNQFFEGVVKFSSHKCFIPEILLLTHKPCCSPFTILNEIEES